MLTSVANIYAWGVWWDGEFNALTRTWSDCQRSRLVNQLVIAHKACYSPNHGG